MKKVLSASLVLLLLVVVFAGCSSKSLKTFAEEQNEIYSKMSTDQFSIECTASGKTLTFTYTYKVEGMTKEIAQSSLDASESTYGAVLSAAKTAGYDCDTVAIEFKGKDGTVLASKEIK